MPPVIQKNPRFGEDFFVFLQAENQVVIENCFVAGLEGCGTTMYAIVDIETTGGGGNARITEIAVYRHDGQRVVDSFHSLINPETFIPPFITRLTGIDNAMVKDSPTFYDVQDSVRKLTQDAWFVAHNVRFDYGFIKREFGAFDEYFQRDLLCTVQLSRKIFPGLRSYSLGNLCQSLEIQLENRHRAQGDAQATVLLFEKLLNNDRQRLIPFDIYQQA